MCTLLSTNEITSKGGKILIEKDATIFDKYWKKTAVARCNGHFYELKMKTLKKKKIKSSENSQFLNFRIVHEKLGHLRPSSMKRIVDEKSSKTFQILKNQKKIFVMLVKLVT